MRKGTNIFFPRLLFISEGLEGSFEACTSFSQIYKEICTYLAKVVFIGSEESATFLSMDPDPDCFIERCRAE
jgi:hypothetical protein